MKNTALLFKFPVKSQSASYSFWSKTWFLDFVLFEFYISLFSYLRKSNFEVLIISQCKSIIICTPDYYSISVNWSFGTSFERNGGNSKWWYWCFVGLVLIPSERGLIVLIKDAFSALSLKNICVEDCISAKISSKTGLSHIIPYQFPTKSQRRYNRPFESLLPSVVNLIVFDNLQIYKKQTNFILSKN